MSPPQLGRCANSLFEPEAQLFAAAPYEPAAYLYDGVVALALAMDAAAAKDTTEEAQGRESVGANLLKELKEHVYFDGASGGVDLDDVTGDRKPATLRFALESFDDTFSAEPMILAYSVRAVRPDDSTTDIEMVATKNGSVQWIDGKGQPEDAITSQVRGCLPPAPRYTWLSTTLYCQLRCLHTHSCSRQFDRPKMAAAQRFQEEKAEGSAGGARSSPTQQNPGGRDGRRPADGDHRDGVRDYLLGAGAARRRPIRGPPFKPGPHQKLHRLLANPLCALYQVSPWHLIRDRTAAKARAVRFVFVKVHRRWLKLRSTGAIFQRVAVDDDDAREIRGNALLVAAGWRPGLHVPLTIWGLRDQLTSAGKATAMPMGAEVTSMEVQVEVQACPNPGNVGGRRTGRTRGSGGDGTTPQSSSSRCSNSNSNRSSFVARDEVDPVTRRLLTACNTDWRVQPNAIDVCKAPTAAQVPRSLQPSTTHHARFHHSPIHIAHLLYTSCRAIDMLEYVHVPSAQVQANLLDLEFNLPHLCLLFRKYAEAETLLDFASGGGDGNDGSSGGDRRHGGGSGGESRMFPGQRMTEDGWMRFQRVEQHEHNAVEQLKFFRAAANRCHKTSTPSTTGTGLPPPYATGLLPRAGLHRRPRDEAKPETYLYQAKPDDAKGSSNSVVVAGSDSLTFVEFVKLLLSPANRALDPAALVPEEGHADAPLTHFWIATSHNSYAVGHQLTGYANEAMYRRQLLQGCRSLEIDCWNGARGEPVVTHGNTLVNKISFASVAKAVAETAFVTSQAPVLLSLEMHCGAKQQARIAHLLKKELGALLLTCTDLESLVEAQSPALGSFFGEQPSERELPFQALQGRVLLKAKLPELTPDDYEEPRVTTTTTQESRVPTSIAESSRESMSLPSKRPNAKGGSKGVIEPSLRALITMRPVPAPHFMAGKLPLGGQGLPVSSLSEPLLQSVFAAAGDELRAEAAAKVQRITRGWQARALREAVRVTRPCMPPWLRSSNSPAVVQRYNHCRVRAVLRTGARLPARHAHQVRQRRPALPVGHGRAAGGAQPADK